MESPVFKNFLYWYESPSNPLSKDELPQNSAPYIREWLFKHGLIHEISTIDDRVYADSRDIGEITTGRWSSYADNGTTLSISHYFFEEEIDAMAFKLKFL